MTYLYPPTPKRRLLAFSAALLALVGCVSVAAAQSTGTISGTVTMKETSGPLHGASVLIVELGRSALSGDDGVYRFERVPPGAYHVAAHLDGLFTEAAKTVNLAAGGEATADFTLELTTQRYEVTVTASEKQETAFESFNAVNSLDAYSLAERTDVSLGEALSHQVGTGIAKRSFGPGAARPIIRGFDGDRVLVMEDGIRTGTLSSQSGDHGELINPAQLERLEIVKGPATLLYSGNAMGGTVNAVSRHHEMHQHAHQGLRGFVSGSAGSANALAGGATGFEYGIGKWMLWGEAGGTRSGDYNSPQGVVFNSRSRIANGGGGLGWYGDKTFFSFDTKVDRGSYGVPFAQVLHGDHAHEEGGADGEEQAGEGDAEAELERVGLDSRRNNYRFSWGLREMGSLFESFNLKLNYTDWAHDEIEFREGGEREIATEFGQQQFIYRGVFEQRARGPLSGRFGFWGLDRAYDVTGEEALSPPVDQTGFAVFALEELGFERVKFQFGGRLETERYTPAFAARGHAHEDETPGEEEGHDEEIADAVNRNFTGASAGAGIHADLWKGGAFVANYSHNYRAPALEELYNFGPHIGNLAFEIGDPNLNAETGNGLDLSLRHNEGRVRGDLNLFYYAFSNFVFPFATGEEDGGLRVIEFTQRDARFTGAEANLNLGVHRNLWLNLGLDFVDAQDTNTNTPLPRIPPLRGKFGVTFNRSGFQITPELILASQQHQTFTGETRTPGYAVIDLKASYTYAQQHLAHQFSVNVFNVGDRLYRNHSSFIKDLAPEIGRGVRFTYMVRFF
ncbi:MAG: TonB-dependent receptor [Bryobacterales bacterium]